MFAVTIILGVTAQMAIETVHALAVREEPSPMKKVIHLLEDMKKELEHEAETEAEIFDKALCACETGEKDLQKVIEDATAQIAAATAKIETESAGKAQLVKELAVHKGEKESAEASLAEGAEIRASENKKFVEDETETANSINQLDMAIPALEKGNRGAALVQMTSLVMKAKSYLAEKDRRSMLAFLGTRHGAIAGSPASDEILGMMKAMHDEMSADLQDRRKDEQTGKDEYLAMKKEKERELVAAMEALRDKEKRNGMLALSLQETKDVLEDAQQELEKAQQYLADLQEECSRKEKDRAMRKEARGEELVALGEAMKVLKDDDAQEVVKKALPRSSFLQRPMPVSLPVYELDFSFVQTASTTEDKGSTSGRGLLGGRYEPPESEARKKVKESEGKIGDMFAAYKEDKGIEEDKGSTKEGREAVDNLIKKHEEKKAANWKPEKPVNRIVRGIVDDMSYGLHKTDVEDEVKFEYCTKELATNEELQKKKQAQQKVLTSQVEKLAVTIEPLEGEIKLLEESINAQDKQVLDWTAQRKSEHDEFATGYANMGMAVKIIKKGMKILEKFYRPALLQRPGTERQSQRVRLAMLGETSAEHRRSLDKMAKKLVPDDWDERDDSMAQLLKRQHKSARHPRNQRDDEIQESEIHRIEEKLAPHWDDESLLQMARGKHRVEPVKISETPTTYHKKESGGVIGLMQDMITELKVDMKEAEGEENHAAIDYQRAMSDAKMAREADMKSLIDKRVVLARNKEQLAQYQGELDLVEKELKNLEIVLLTLHHECDFIAANYPAQHEARVNQDVSAKEIFKLIKHPIPSREQVEQQFEAEKTMKNVATNYPNQTKTDE